MPVHYSDLAELNFDRDAYSEERPLGIWKAKVDQVVWNKGSRPSVWRKGCRAGIHLYVQHENGQKIWLFVPFMRGLASFALAVNLEAGDTIEVEIASSTTTLSIVERLRKVEQFPSAEEERNSQTDS